MTMHKKDYEAVAAIIKEGLWFDQNRSPIIRARWFTTAIADYCATQDPTFKRDRFLADCGVQS